MTRAEIEMLDWKEVDAVMLDKINESDCVDSIMLINSRSERKLGYGLYAVCFKDYPSQDSDDINVYVRTETIRKLQHNKIYSKEGSMLWDRKVRGKEEIEAIKSMKEFQYKGFGGKTGILIDEGLEEAAEVQDIKVELIKTEDVKIMAIGVKMIANKYKYKSKSTGKEAFAYTWIENHGPEGFDTYFFTTQGDFDDLLDLFDEFFIWYELS